MASSKRSIRILFLPIVSKCKHNSFVSLKFIDRNWSGKNISKPLPAYFWGLSASIIDLSFTNITGEIPAVPRANSNLRQLTLSDNHLNGPIPDSMGSLIEMTELDLSRNNLSFFIPKTIKLMKNLRVIHLESNRLIGELPDSTNLTHLAKCNIYNEGVCHKSIPSNDICNYADTPTCARKADCQILVDWVGSTWLQSYASTNYNFCKTSPNNNISALYIWYLI